MKFVVPALAFALVTCSDAETDPPTTEVDAGEVRDAGNAADAGATADAGDASTPDAGAMGQRRPNILLIIADDMGLDSSAQYGLSQDLPSTPTLDALAADGVVFDNAWATPACTTTRGTIISGQHGVNSGVTFVPAVLPASTESLQDFLAADMNTSAYTNAIFGKWHLGGGMPAVDNPTSSVFKRTLAISRGPFRTTRRGHSRAMA